MQPLLEASCLAAWGCVAGAGGGGEGQGGGKGKQRCVRAGWTREAGGANGVPKGIRVCVRRRGCGRSVAASSTRKGSGLVQAPGQQLKLQGTGTPAAPQNLLNLARSTAGDG